MSEEPLVALPSLSCRRFGINLMAGGRVQFILGETYVPFLFSRAVMGLLALTNLYCISIYKQNKWTLICALLIKF